MLLHFYNITNNAVSDKDIRSRVSLQVPVGQPTGVSSASWPHQPFQLLLCERYPPGTDRLPAFLQHAKSSALSDSPRKIQHTSY